MRKQESIEQTLQLQAARQGSHLQVEFSLAGTRILKRECAVRSTSIKNAAMPEEGHLPLGPHIR